MSKLEIVAASKPQGVFDIILDGKKIGKVEPHLESLWWAAIDLPMDDGETFTICGSGGSREVAIESAFARGRAYHMAALAAIQHVADDDSFASVLMTVMDVGLWLSLRGSQVKRLARTKQLPHIVLPTGDFVFDRAELVEWLKSRRS